MTRPTTPLAWIADGSSWDLPIDDEVHALGTDAISRAVLSGGLLYPCQSIFSNSSTPGPFRSVPCPDPRDRWESRYCIRPFLIIEGCGVIVKRTITPVERAMISGLARVTQRISSSSLLRYLTEAEVANSSSLIAPRYREFAKASHCSCAQ